MLIKCPECELQVSDKASTCPHCGYPIRPYNPSTQTKTSTKRNPNKRMRLPNGFGQITEIKKKNLRNPYRVMITVGKNEFGKPICKLLKPEAYFPTYNDAYAALVEYNKNPYDLDDEMTLKELYEKWSEEYFKKLKSASSERTIRAAWKNCSQIYDMRVKDIRVRHIKGCMESASTTNMKFRIKSMFNIMFDYALEYELVDRNYARTFVMEENDVEDRDSNKKEHLSFTDDEMNIIWNTRDNEMVKWILIQCYTGWRPQELGLIKLEDVDLENMIIKGGMKTKAGKDRVVPVHESIKDEVKKIWEMSNSRGSKYFISDPDGSMITYDKYNKRFAKMMSALKINPEHRPHDPRKHFVTICKKYNVDEYAIKRMVGHAITDITEDIYTDRDIEWLRTELQKVKGPAD